MASVTFEFKNEKNWLRVWEALNDTAIHFASYGYLAITIFDEVKAEEVKKACKDARIAIKEI